MDQVSGETFNVLMSLQSEEERFLLSHVFCLVMINVLCINPACK